MRLKCGTGCLFDRDRCGSGFGSALVPLLLAFFFEGLAFNSRVVEACGQVLFGFPQACLQLGDSSFAGAELLNNVGLRWPKSCEVSARMNGTGRVVDQISSNRPVGALTTTT